MTKVKSNGSNCRASGRLKTFLTSSLHHLKPEYFASITELYNLPWTMVDFTSYMLSEPSSTNSGYMTIYKSIHHREFEFYIYQHQHQHLSISMRLPWWEYRGRLNGGSVPVVSATDCLPLLGLTSHMQNHCHRHRRQQYHQYTI